jgi:hypothetical protein
MAKILTIKDNINLPGNNIGDIIATYEDSARVYKESDFLSLAEFDNLERAIKLDDKDEIYKCKLELAKKICIEEQFFILTGVFDLVEKEGTLTDVQKEIKAMVPEQKKVWIDPKTGEAKELVNPPQYAVRMVDGELSHTFDTVENSKVLNKI